MNKVSTLGEALVLLSRSCEGSSFPFFIPSRIGIGEQTVLGGIISAQVSNPDVFALLIDHRLVGAYTCSDRTWVVGAWDDHNNIDEYILSETRNVISRYAFTMVEVKDIFEIITFVRGGVKALGAAKLGVRS